MAPGQLRQEWVKRWEVFRDWVAEPQLSSAQRDTLALPKDTHQCHLPREHRLVLLKPAAERRGHASFPFSLFTVSENHGVPAPEDPQFWSPNLQRPREGE